MKPNPIGKKKNKQIKKPRINSGMFLKGMLDFENLTTTNDDTIFKVKVEGKDKYISILMISGIDIFHYTDDDMESVFSNFAKATSAMKVPHKYVFTNQTPFFGQQKEYLKYKINRTDHKYTKAMLSKKLNELEVFEEKHKDRLAYLIAFADDIEELMECCIRYQRNMIDTDVKFCTSEDTKEFLNKYLCFDDESLKLKKYKSVNDCTLPDTVQFTQNSYKIDDNYVTSLIVNDYPAYLLDLELANIVSTYSDCIITFDVRFRPKQQVISEIKNSLKELDSRSVIKQDVSDDIDTKNEFDKLTAIYNDISCGNENMVYTTLRFIVSNKDFDCLKKRVRDISEDLESKGLDTFIPINEMKNEYFGMIKENNIVQTPYPLQDTFKRQFPFYYQSHTDPSGIFFGYTDTYGLNIFNSFYRNSRQGRNSYDLIAVGVKGSGKSVTLKSMLQDQIILGNKVMVLDIESEYKEMARIYDGQIIRMNRRSTINPLQIRVTVDTDAENTDLDESEIINKSEINAINYTSEISRICTFMTQYNPSFSDEELSFFRDILVEVYKQKGIYEETDVSGFVAEQFPLFSDVLNYIVNKQNNVHSEYELTVYKKLENQIKQLCKGGAYGSMFDNYTNVNIEEKSLIIFDVKQISELDTNIYNAQLFNILSLMWSEICKNLTINKHITNPYNRRNIVCLIDEAHRFISTRNPQVTDFIEKLLRRSRKYDAALWFASQSILDFLPSGQSEETDRIKKIFQLVQYKIILKQSTDCITSMHNIFEQFTMSELRSTVSFEAGEMLMSLSSGRHKVHCQRQASLCDLMYIGNSQDQSEIIHKIFNEYYKEYTAAEYGSILRNSKEKCMDFVTIFTQEAANYLGFNRSDSEYLYLLVETVVTNLCNELIEMAKEK